MDTAHFRDLAALWRMEAETFRRRGQSDLAAMALSYADELEARIRDWEGEELPVSIAAEESGYSEDHLRMLVRKGVIPDARPPTSGGPIMIRRCDLPKKPGQIQGPVQDLAAAIRLSKSNS